MKQKILSLVLDALTEYVPESGEFGIGIIAIEPNDKGILIETAEGEQYQIKVYQTNNDAERVDELAKQDEFYVDGVFIPRIKAVRILNLGKDQTWGDGKIGTSLRWAKEWVEEHFADHGRGEPL